jgi:hypothetical protein
VLRVAISPARWPASHAGPSRSERAVSARRSCDLTVAGARRAHLPAVAHRRPGCHHDQQRRQRGRQGGNGVAAGSPGERTGEQPSLCQDQAGSGQSERDRNHQISSRGRSMTQQPRINECGAPPAGAHAAEHASRQSKLAHPAGMNPGG